MKQSMVWSVVLPSVLVASSGMAALPPMESCMTGSAARGYDAGYMQETNWLESLWTTHDFDCDRLEDYISAIDVPFDPTPVSSPFLLCRNAGISAAIADVQIAKQAKCGGQCLENGSNIGKQRAQTFCAVSRLVMGEKGMKGTLGPKLCPVLSMQGCSAAFTSYVDSNCPVAREMDPSTFEKDLKSACKGF
jgi:hypothetical protein